MLGQRAKAAAQAPPRIEAGRQWRGNEGVAAVRYLDDAAYLRRVENGWLRPSKVL